MYVMSWLNIETQTRQYNWVLWALLWKVRVQFQPFSLTIWANSMMNFPSLYFWLASNALSYVIQHNDINIID